MSTLIGLFLATLANGAEPLVLVRDGRAEATIYHEGDAANAAADLAATIARMTGATLEVKTVRAAGEVPAAAPAVAMGRLALSLGLPRPPQTVSGDGYRILRRGYRLLMAGETADSTFYASTHFLETLGCRWFFGNDIGTVVPRTRSIRVESLDLEEKPDFLSRNLWGPNWRDEGWRLHNRLGGLGMPTGHDWGYVPAAKHGKEHPEYYSLRGGARRPGGWLCTTNSDVQRIFAEGVCRDVASRGPMAVSISPPDGTAYCECSACRALDDPEYLEPSSGNVVITDRYLRFFNAIAREALKANSQAILNFYAYADYSRPPRHAEKAPENLCAWLAPIRYCRFHSLGNPLCAARQRLRGEIDQWKQAVSKVGWREYNYNLAELTVPFSKISVWRDDIPTLHRLGCIGLNIECLFMWHLYGPHTWLAARLAWDADADVDALMDDFYSKFCGPAAPHIKAYWERIDRAYRATDIHVGSFFGIHAVWTPALLDGCRADLDAAMKAADDELLRRRVAMFRAGLGNVEYFLDLRESVNRCDFGNARQVYDAWIAHMDRIHAEGIHAIGEYRDGYAPRFLSAAVNEGHAKTTGDNRLLLELPDAWLFRVDPSDAGEGAGWYAGQVATENWRTVRTFSATLAEQGIGETLSILWYRVAFDVPALPEGRALRLWFAEVDGKPTKVYLNGELLGETTVRRAPFEFEVTGKLRPGKNVVAVRTDHRRISELSLGGIIKPAMVYSAPAGR